MGTMVSGPLSGKDEDSEEAVCAVLLESSVSLMSTWKTLELLQLNFLQRLVAAFKRHVNCCRASQAQEVFPLCFASAHFHALAHPTCDRKRAESQGKGKSKGKTSVGRGWNIDDFWDARNLTQTMCLAIYVSSADVQEMLH